VIEIIYLKKGERAPRSKNLTVIEVVSDRSQEVIESGPNGVKLRVNKSNFESVLADLRKKASAQTQTLIYVKGAIVKP
jgi:PP-loop superfamily ATP-utilizing enzyme